MTNAISAFVPIPFAASQAVLDVLLTVSQVTLDAIRPAGPTTRRKKLHGESNHPFDLEQKKR